jgi:hypothetical protein
MPCERDIVAGLNRRGPGILIPREASCLSSLLYTCSVAVAIAALHLGHMHALGSCDAIIAYCEQRLACTRDSAARKAEASQVSRVQHLR